MTILETQALAAKNAARVLASAGTVQKDAALEAIAQAVEARRQEIIAANARDLAAARTAMAAGIDMVIANSARLDALYDLAEGRSAGTRFVARPKP